MAKKIKIVIGHVQEPKIDTFAFWKSESIKMHKTFALCVIKSLSRNEYKKSEKKLYIFLTTLCK